VFVGGQWLALRARRRACAAAYRTWGPVNQTNRRRGGRCAQNSARGPHGPAFGWPGNLLFL